MPETCTCKLLLPWPEGSHGNLVGKYYYWSMVCNGASGRSTGIPSGICTMPLFPVDLGIDIVLPHTLISAGSVTDLLLGNTDTSAADSIWPWDNYMWCVVSLYDFNLLAPDLIPLLEGIRFVMGYW